MCARARVYEREHSQWLISSTARTKMYSNNNYCPVISSRIPKRTARRYCFTGAHSECLLLSFVRGRVRQEKQTRPRPTRGTKTTSRILRHAALRRRVLLSFPVQRRVLRYNAYSTVYILLCFRTYCNLLYTRCPRIKRAFGSFGRP